MKSFLQQYFYYSRAERNGAFVLALLCAVLFLFPKIYPHLIKSRRVEAEAYREEALAFFAELQAADSLEQRPAAEAFYFDPNTISRDSLLLLGLPPKTAATIIKYREKVNPFYRPEDLRKVFTLREKDYQRLAPYIRLNAPPAPARQVKMERKEQTAPALQPFPFDPNTATEAELARLGLPERLAHNMLKYREKGGHFSQPEALKKIYGMEEEVYRALAPFIEIEDASQPPAPKGKNAGEEYPPAYSQTPSPKTIDINTANEQEWQQLYGIGPAYARRIVKFRDKLGGFANIGQVGETYGLADSTFQQIRPHLQLSPVIRKLNINTAAAAALTAHPYLDWRKANAIVNYRAQHGPFKGIGELRKLKALPADVVDRLEPYLEF